MTVIPSRPGLEATVFRFYQGRKSGISNEYEPVTRRTWQMDEHSSLVYLKCLDKEEIILQVLVTEEHLEVAAQDDFTNADYHLACVAYINGVKQPQFKLLKKGMPGCVRSKFYTIDLKHRGNGKVGKFMVEPEDIGAPHADVQLQIYRYYVKAPPGARKIKKEGDKKNAGLQSRSDPSDYHIKKQSKGSPFAMRYIDEKSEPYALFRFYYHTVDDTHRNGRMKIIPKSRVMLPRHTAHIDLTSDEPVRHPEVVDLTDNLQSNGAGADNAGSGSNNKRCNANSHTKGARNDDSISVQSSPEPEDASPGHIPMAFGYQDSRMAGPSRSAPTATGQSKPDATSSRSKARRKPAVKKSKQPSMSSKAGVKKSTLAPRLKTKKASHTSRDSTVSATGERDDAEKDDVAKQSTAPQKDGIAEEEEIQEKPTTDQVEPENGGEGNVDGEPGVVPESGVTEGLASASGN